MRNGQCVYTTIEVLLRKTYASILFANGVEEKIAQQQLRHKDSSVTHKYYEFSIRSREYKRNQLNRADVLRSNIQTVKLPKAL